MKTRILVIALMSAFGVSSVVATTSYAQTAGVERRGDRREDRQGARDEKHECKAGDEKTRPECRQDKREGKQEDRGNENAVPPELVPE
jgi:hypothetical protein